MVSTTRVVVLMVAEALAFIVLMAIVGLSALVGGFLWGLETMKAACMP